MIWQPIETAPVNGTPVLLFAGLLAGNTVMAKTRVVGHYSAGHGWLAHSYAGQSLAYLEPSHWMSLPEFPEAEQ